MIRSTVSRIGRIAAIACIGALAAVGTATAAHAGISKTGTVQPGGELCSVRQYASFAVSGFGAASGQLPAGGAKLKLMRDGEVVKNTPGRVNSETLAGGSGTGPFFGAGYYKICAHNTGAAPVDVGLIISIDREV